MVSEWSFQDSKWSKKEKVFEEVKSSCWRYFWELSPLKVWSLKQILFEKFFGISLISGSILKRISRLGKVKEFLPLLSILLVWSFSISSSYIFKDHGFRLGDRWKEGDLFFSGYISSNKDTWLIDSSAFKYMIGYKRILADLDLFFLKYTHVTLSHVIWISMMISRRQVKWILWKMVDSLIKLLALIIQVCFELSQQFILVY